MHRRSLCRSGGRKKSILIGCMLSCNFCPALHGKCRAFFRKSPKIRLHKGEINLNYTKKLSLKPIGHAADRVLREDFNRDNETIDAALAAVQDRLDSLQARHTLQLIKHLPPTHPNTAGSPFLWMTSHGRTGISSICSLMPKCAPPWVTISCSTIPTILCSATAPPNTKRT